MERSTVEVSRTELEHAIAVWLAVAPSPIYRRLTRQLLLAEQKRHDGDPLPDFQSQIAAHVAERLMHAGWTVSRPDRAGPLFG